MNHFHDNIRAFADGYVHDLLTNSERQQLIEHCDQCAGCQSELQKARERLAVFSDVPQETVSDALIQKSIRNATGENPAPDVFYAPSPLTRTEKTFWAIVATAALLFAIIHLIVSGLSPTPYDLVVYGQSKLIPDTQGSIRVLLMDRNRNRPVSKQPVTVDLVNSRNGSNVRLASFVTDENGTGNPTFNLPAWKDDDYELKITSRAGRTRHVVSRVVRFKRDWKVMLSTDKPVYQPGQTIRVRSLALRRPDLLPVTGQQIEYRVVDPKGNIIFKQIAVSSRFGISAFDCPLATELIHGAYKVECEIGNSASTVTVDVKPYVLPKFRVAVKLDKPFYQPGDRIRGVVDANYFFGKPVVGASVEVQTTTNGPDEKLQTQSSAVTDKNGKSTFEFPVPDGLTGSPVNRGDARLELNVVIRDTANQQHETLVTALVTDQPIRIDLVPESSSLVAREANRMFVFTSYADGRPAKARLSVSGLVKELNTNKFGVASFEFTPKRITRTGRNLYGIRDSAKFAISASDAAGLRGNREIRLGFQHLRNDFVVRLDKVAFDGGQTVDIQFFGSGNQPVLVDVVKDKQTLVTQSVRMEKGAGELHLDLTPEMHGILQLRAYRFDDRGFPIQKDRAIFVRRASQLKIHAELDKSTYRPGETAKLKLQIRDRQGKPKPGALSLAAVDEAVFSVNVKRPVLGQTFFALDQTLLKPVYQIYPWTPNFSENDDPDRTEFEVAAFSRIRQEGSDRNARLHDLVDNYLGGDTSILEVLERPDVDELAENMWLPPEVLELIKSDDSIHSLVARTWPEQKRKFTIWQNQFHGFATGMWWLFGVSVLVAVFFSLCRHYGFRIIEFVVVIFILFLLIGMMLPSVQQVREAARRSTAQNSLRHLGIAFENQRSVHGDESPSSAAQPDAAPRIRQWFPETLLWRPEQITNDDGEMTVEIPVADSITTWKLSASGVTADGILGARENSIRVFQPFFVDLNLPISLTRGDEISIPVVVYNYLDKPQDVQISLQDSDWFRLLEPGQKSLSLAANEMRTESFRIRATRLGEQKLLVIAKGDAGVSDAIRKGIEIAAEGTPNSSAVNGTIDNAFEHNFTFPKDLVEGTGKAVVKLYPSSFSQIVEGLDSIFQRPYGCFEQTSSTTYPSVLALDYLRDTGKNLPEVEARALQYIQLGYQRLLTFEVDAGGFDWFGNPPANRTLTAYGLMEFRDMSRVSHVDPALIQRTERWLLSHQKADGSWEPEQHAMHDDPTAGLNRLATTAYIAWAVFDATSPASASNSTRSYLLSHSPDSIESPYVLALVCNALMAIGERESARPYVQRLAGMSRRSMDEKMRWWSTIESRQTLFFGSGISGDIETTAMATLAMLESGRHPALAARALKWLAAKKDTTGGWHSTQATVLALKALLRGTGEPLSDKAIRRITIKHNGTLVKELTIPADQADVVQQVVLRNLEPDRKHVIRLEEIDQSNTGFQIATMHNIQDVQTGKTDALKIDLVYDRNKLEVNDHLGVTASVTNQMDEDAPMVMVTLPIPPGFEINRIDFERLRRDSLIAKFEANPRSVILYFRSIKAEETVGFRYQLTATMPLKAQIAPAHVYLYYDPQTRGRSEPATVLVNAR